MDRMQVCGTCDPGSIPGESTDTNDCLLAVFSCQCEQKTIRGIVFKESKLMRDSFGAGEATENYPHRVLIR